MAKEILKKPIPDNVRAIIDYAQGDGYCNDTLNGEATPEELLAILTHCTPRMPQTGVEEWQREKFREACDYVYNAYEKIVPFDYSKASGIAAESPLELDLFRDVLDVPFPAPKNPTFTFIDLFAGIGGFRIAMQELGGKCVYSSEFDPQAQKSYFANYGDMPFGDITKEVTKSYIPKEFDVLCGGFPCQAFSLAGRRLGFKDETRGTLFFEIEDILRRHQPKAFFLENVKGLAIHDKGRTLRTILEHLDDAGYDVVKPQILNAMDYGVPQHRERIYIIGFRKDLRIDVDNFHYPVPTTPAGKRVRFRDVMEKSVPSVKYYLSNVYVETLKRHRARHEAAGHGFGYEIIDKDGVANAIVVGGMGRERNLVIDNRLTDFTPVTNIKGEVNRDGIRRMTPREWARLQGFPEEFKIVVADASAYKQFGNSVAIPAIKATAEKELELLGVI